MPTRSIVWAGLFGVAVAALTGCPSKEPVEPVATAEPEPDPPKKTEKPKPKCEELAEKCAATADTQAKIANADSVFVPPEGWHYAQQTEMTIAQPDGTPGAMAITAFEGAGPEEAKARDASYEKLVQGLAISPPEKFKKKFVPRWDKPDDARKTGSTEIKLWQAEKAKRDGKDGFLLVLLTSDPAGKKILGVAFSPEGDDKTVEAISKSLETIGPGSYQ
ncbi:MAG: hypothetical protein HOW73_21150 [Polyangiaceae bacterium]|nr:hypothetical protein [Polyangiaceae bacterium]